jgi:YHS domain-containing protein
MKKISVVFSLLAFSLISIQAQKSPTYLVEGKAIRGYDPVSYFTEGKPVKGNDKLVLKWNDTHWYFSSQKNLDLFKANPEKYAPQYGGYCAYGLSKGYKAKTVPEAWTIDNGKLYLNYSLGVRDEWDKDRQDRIIKANNYWPRVKDKE